MMVMMRVMVVVVVMKNLIVINAVLQQWCSFLSPSDPTK